MIAHSEGRKTSFMITAGEDEKERIETEEGRLVNNKKESNSKILRKEYRCDPFKFLVYEISTFEWE